jgi:hypothetical protein
VPHGEGSETSLPEPTAWVKQTAIMPRVTAMPADPISSSGRRPIRSMREMATRVTTTLVTLVITVMVSARDSVNPTERHSVVE